MNDDHEPTEKEEAILKVFKTGRESGDPWGYASPDKIKRATGLNDYQVNYALNSLTSAGWVERENKGFYRFVADPREGIDP